MLADIYRISSNKRRVNKMTFVCIGADVGVLGGSTTPQKYPLWDVMGGF